jgi:hypothetical protein
MSFIPYTNILLCNLPIVVTTVEAKNMAPVILHGLVVFREISPESYSVMMVFMR